MCKVYNTIGCLTTIKRHLAQNKIDNFHSVWELRSFQNNYAAERQQIISNQKDLTTKEANNLRIEILQLENEIENTKIRMRQKSRSEIENLRRQFEQLAEAEKTYIEEFTFSFKALFILIKINYVTLLSAITITRALRGADKILTEKRNRLQSIDSNIDAAVSKSCVRALHNLDRKKRVIDEINTVIYGAIGEQQVVKQLEQLPDEYILINDFNFSFTKPIFYEQDAQYIKTIQIDHLLISPSGIFLIETKNWSKESLKNISLRSPVKQIKRTSFALYKIIHGNTDVKLDQHHWGERKIPIRNLIVIISQKPREEFQHVKILTLDELLHYIMYFKPSLSNQETQEISNYLINVRL